MNKKKMLAVLIVMLFGVLCRINIAAQTLTINDSDGSYIAGTHFSILEDAERKYSIDSIIDPKTTAIFKKSSIVKPNFGYTDSIYWVRISIDNQSKNSNFILEIDYPQIDYVSFFWKEKDRYSEKKAGDQLPLSVRDIKHRNSAFYFTQEPNSVKDYYLSFKTEGNMLLPVVIWKTNYFYQKDHYEQIILGIFYGLIMIMILYNLFIFIALKDPSYIVFVMFLLFFMFFSSSLSGLTYEYLLDTKPWMVNKILAFLVSGCVLTSVLFAISFLQTKKLLPVIHKILLVLIAISSALMVLSFFVKYSTIIKISVAFVILDFFFLFIVGIISFIKKYRPARFYILAWTIAFTGYIVVALKNLGLIPSNLLTEYSSQLGTSFLVTLLSLALADRINIFKQEKEEAQKEMIENQKKSLEIQTVMATSFERFVPKEFLKFLKKESIIDVHVGDHTQLNMTIMFSDIRSFTTLSEKMSIEENFKFINSCLKRFNPIITNNFGFIDKYIGDAVMALFYKTPLDAVKSAVEIQEELQVYNGHRAKMNYDPVEIGVGLHNGELMLGTVGQENRIDTTVISDSVNLTSRIEGLNKLYGSGTIISEQLFLAIENFPYHYRYLDMVTVKGKKVPIKIIEVIDGLPPHIAEKKIQTGDLFKKGIELYQQKSFDEALNKFNEIISIHEDDLAAQVYIDRCNSCKKFGVPDDWDGISNLTMK
ncbi:MAG: guanylate cyclase [bacterium]|nr:guanylate cyclase [bacterium]